MLYPNDPLLGLSLDQLPDTDTLVNCGDPQLLGGGACFGPEYWSRSFPNWLQDPGIGIHIKEFWVVIVSAWLCGVSGGGLSWSTFFPTMWQYLKCSIRRSPRIPRCSNSSRNSCTLSVTGLYPSIQKDWYEGYQAS